MNTPESPQAPGPRPADGPPRDATFAVYGSGHDEVLGSPTDAAPVQAADVAEVGVPTDTASRPRTSYGARPGSGSTGAAVAFGMTLLVMLVVFFVMAQMVVRS